MRRFLGAVVIATLMVVAGCIAPPQEAPPDRVEGTSMHIREEREKLWKRLYQEAEKETAGGASKPSGSEPRE